MAQQTMSHNRIEAALFVMVAILLGVNIVQIVRAVSWCAEVLKG